MSEGVAACWVACRDEGGGTQGGPSRRGGLRRSGRILSRTGGRALKSVCRIPNRPHPTALPWPSRTSAEVG